MFMNLHVPPLEKRPKRDVQFKTAKGVGSGLLSYQYPAVRPDFERVLLGVFEQRSMTSNGLEIT